MNVRELIEFLLKEDPEARVVVPGYEGGYDDLTVVKQISLSLNENLETSYLGSHEELEYSSKTIPDCTAVLVHGRGRE